MKGGDLVEIEATHIDLEGRGVARVLDRDAEREVLTPGLFGGEVARVRIEHVSRGGPVAHARLVDLVRGERRPVPCAQHVDREGRCGGCPLMALEGAAQREQKRQMLATLGLHVDALRHDERELGYRVSSKRVAFGSAGRLVLGSFARGSHTPADMHGCLVEHPALSAAASGVVRVAQRLGIVAFDERRGDGLLRAVWLRLVAPLAERGEVVMTLVTTREPDAAFVDALAKLANVRVVAWSRHAGVGNDLRGEAPTLLRGAVEDSGLLGFLQPNAPLAEQMYDALLDDEHGAPLRGERAFDLFAGAGATTRRLRERFAHVEASESYPESAAMLGVAPTTVEAFLAAATTTPELVIANPPRKGLGDEVVEQLLRLAPPRLQIMACGPRGLARDLVKLEASGYRLAELLAFDTLPQTPHVELVAKLVRE